MIDIVFNGKTYPVDESIYNEAKNQIKEHLATTMNGTGAVINFDGVDYNVSSTKLNEVAEELVEHLSTELSGTGAIIVINGVSYPVDAGKLESTKDIFDNALTELKSLAPGLYQTGAIELYRNGNREAASAMMISSWSDLEADGTVAISEGEPEIVLPEQPSTPPTLNEYGFYYGVAYSMGTSVVATFNADGSAIAIIEGERSEIPAGVIVYGNHSIDMTAIDFGTAVVSEDGTQLEFVDVDEMVLTANPDVYGCGVYLGVPYSASINGQILTLTFNADGSVTMFDGVNMEVTEIPAESIVYGDHVIDMTAALPDCIFDISQDGTQLMLQNITFNIGFGRPPKGTVYLPKMNTDVTVSIIEGDLVLPCEGRVTGLDNDAFYKQLLTGILLPDGITTIGERAFYYCTALTSINFAGTIAQWGAIEKNIDWSLNVPATYVQCSDGQVAL